MSREFNSEAHRRHFLRETNIATIQQMQIVQADNVRILLKAGGYKRAVEVCKKVLQIDNTSTPFIRFCNYAQYKIYLNMGDFKKANHLYREHLARVSINGLALRLAQDKFMSFELVMEQSPSIDDLFGFEDELSHILQKESIYINLLNKGKSGAMTLKAIYY